MGLIQKPTDDFTITFGFYGAEQDGGQVRVNDLAKCLTRMEDCLHATERCIRNKKATLAYVITDLEKGSAICSMKARKPRRGADYRTEIVHTVRETIRSLQSGDGQRIDPRLDRTALQSFKKLGDILSPRATTNKKRRMVIDGTEVTSQFVWAVDEVLSIKDITYGSVSGKLEKIDVHDKFQFAIYPAISGHQVVCAFKDDMLEKVKSAVKKTVTVYGAAHYAAGTLFPVRIDVDEIEEHEVNPSARPLGSLVGALSSLPGDSVSLVRKLRDEWRE